MTRLVAEGWVAPADPGPSRRLAGGLLVTSLVLLLAWTVVGTGRYGAIFLDGDETYEVRIAGDGIAEVRRTKSELTKGRAKVHPLKTEVRTSGTTRFVVVRGTFTGVGHGDVDIEVDVPAGVDPELAATRFVPPRAGADRADVMVTIPGSQLPELDDSSSAGALRSITAPLDERIRDARADRRLQRRLHDGWWWILPFGLAATVGGPLWLWRRERRRFFSMRVPGPGRTMDSAPPSSLDPVGAATLVAGARSTDAAAAFCGHVLDLVERRQLRMRRNADPEAGPIGAQLGLAHADEEAVPDDAAVAALRSIARDDGLTVDVPDDVANASRIPASAWGAWRSHVAARVRFERMSTPYRSSRVAAAAAAAAVLALAGVVGVLVAELDGARSASWLVVALMVPATALLAAWARDARRWRVVARDRRTERAQWLAWRGAVGADDGPAYDQRSLPVLVATAPADALVRDTATRDAVSLDAVTTRTLASLRALGDDPA